VDSSSFRKVGQEDLLSSCLVEVDHACLVELLEDHLGPSCQVAYPSCLVVDLPSYQEGEPYPFLEAFLDVHPLEVLEPEVAFEVELTQPGHQYLFHQEPSSEELDHLLLELDLANLWQIFQLNLVRDDSTKLGI